MSDLLNSASLVMIPSGYKEDIVYSEVPTNGNGDLSFTRASNGTRVNSAGLVEVVAWNAIQYSNTFNNGVWATGGYGNLPTLTANSIANPVNGLTDAWGATFASAGTQGRLLQVFAGLPVGVPYTYSMYVKAGTKTSVSIYSDAASIGLEATFNLSTGVVTSASSGVTATITAMSNGWYYLTITNNILSSGNGQYGIITNPGADGSLYIYGAQLNIGSTAKPYFPTTDRLNVPRLTYQNGGGGCPSLLLEKQSTNLCVESNAFNTSPWISGSQSGTNPVINPNYGISPDGTQNAVRIELARQNVGTSYSQIYQHPIAITSGQPYTWSVYLKSLSGTPTISIIGDFGRPSVTLTSEWVRYTGTYTAGSSQTQLELAILGSNYATGNSLSADFLAYGYQIEQSSYPTSYIPTTSSSATRVADACFKTGISSLIGQTEGVMFCDFVFTNNNTVQVIMSLHDNANNKRIEIWASSPTLYGFVGGSSSFNIASITATSGTRYKVAVAYKSGDSAYYVNGTQIGTDSTTFTISLTSLIFNYWGGSYPPDTKINEAIIFPTRLSNSELIALTTI